MRKLNVTDGQTDGRGGVAISPVPGPTGDNKHRLRRSGADLGNCGWGVEFV